MAALSLLSATQRFQARVLIFPFLRMVVAPWR